MAKKTDQKKASAEKEKVELKVVQPTIELIDYRLIDESPMNPRKFFDQDELKELAENIKQQGLLQPITVRPQYQKTVLAGDLEGKHCYEIICGARRYKACVMADIKMIPAIVRNMTDEEAFDAMITENLQRKDVAPMDEARAFTELNKRGISFEELAARFGKSQTFIIQRIKLNDLISEFVEMLDKKDLQVSHAFELCKLDHQEQKEIYDKHYTESGTYYSWINRTTKELREFLARRFNDLDDAIFDKTECQTCQYNCSANLLFSEFEQNTCANTICFDNKTADHIIAEASKKVEEGYILLSSNNSSNSTVAKMKDLGYDFGDIWNYDFEFEKEDSETQKKQIEKGKLKPAWVIDYWSDPRVVYVKPKKNTSSSNNTEPTTEEIIQDLKDKDKRNKEIQNENIIKDLRESFRSSDYEKQDRDISKIEEVALLIIMLRLCDHKFSEQYGVHSWDEKKRKDVYEICANADADLQMKITRAFIKNNLTTNDVNFHKELQRAILNVSSEAFPNETKEITDKHTETYNKRKTNIDKQIEALTTKAE